MNNKNILQKDVKIVRIDILAILSILTISKILAQVSQNELMKLEYDSLALGYNMNNSRPLTNCDYFYRTAPLIIKNADNNRHDTVCFYYNLIHDGKYLERQLKTYRTAPLSTGREVKNYKYIEHDPPMEDASVMICVNDSCMIYLRFIEAWGWRDHAIAIQNMNDTIVLLKTYAPYGRQTRWYSGLVIKGVLKGLPAGTWTLMRINPIWLSTHVVPKGCSEPPQ